VRLTIELVPSTSWGDNLRDGLKIKKGEWERLKRACFERASHRCEVCGGVGKKHPVECHEVWDYDDQNKVQKLVSLVALCPPCHRAKHIGHTFKKLEGWVVDATLGHLARVNQLTAPQVSEMIIEAFGVHRERSNHLWSVDTSIVQKWLSET
jgi:hypothetical protein